ncbi:hypothetical protein [Leptolyngbya sp. 7M]|uniref:hypothetical protein n=1 Tax=Leptolyngbya sp. 7M TaxID=2812896 RepID=UPI001B8C61A7|nr:hypothetical protein [Leptolyngbya sp. 7M]QYO68912.1 hypothetical protein JVX88_34205 [Leptolyngbya sp. 7M]
MTGLTLIAPGFGELAHHAVSVPAAVSAAGEHAARRFIEFFTATIRNPNTRQAYAQAVVQFFDWCDVHGVSDVRRTEPVIVAAYIERLMRERSAWDRTPCGPP